MDKLIIIGKITGAHGVRGELKVFPLTDDPRRFLKLKECIICGQNFEKPEDSSCTSARLDRGRVLLKLKKDNYFITDLKGLKVIDDDRGDLGSVIDCFATGPQFTLEIKRENKKKNLMLPFVKVYCYEVDIEAGYIKCRLPEGLYELYD